MLLNIANSVTDSVEFQIDYDNILLSSSNINERNLWLNNLNKAKKILIASEKNQKQLMESKKADFSACGRVLVFVIDGRKLQTPKFVYAVKLCLGKKAVFCEVSMGSRKQCTPVNESPEPKWDSSMQFLVKDIQDDILCVTVFNEEHYSPDGRSEIRVSEIIQSTKNSRGSLTKALNICS